MREADVADKINGRYRQRRFGFIFSRRKGVFSLISSNLFKS
uniref:Uncharacterized protein n=1 Tax=viral metagenome TaxID=1070528 RepID=A0A6C0KYH4_9ZZZZ